MSPAGGREQMRDRTREAAAYFADPGFRRLLAGTWKKYGSLGRIGGKTVLDRATSEECEAINRFFGWNCKAGKRIEVPLELFEEELRSSRFGIGLAELYEVLYGEPLRSNREKTQSSDAQWQRLFEDAFAQAGGETFPQTVAEWAARVREGKSSGTRTLREKWKVSPEEAVRDLAVALRALGIVFRDSPDGVRSPVRLPVLAARASGDAHALDPDRASGRLLLSCLSECLSGASAKEDAAAQGAAKEDAVAQGASAQSPAESAAAVDAKAQGAAVSAAEAVAAQEVVMKESALGDEADGAGTLRLRELYRRFGILDDDLSSIVRFFVPSDANQSTLPTIWSLRQVEAAENFPACTSIYVVENPAVFSTILDSLESRMPAGNGKPALVCTSGPASAAAIRWIRRCAEGTDEFVRLYYSGDFDVKGLSMGQTLFDLFPERFVPWRFDSAAYLAAVRQRPGPVLDETELEKLSKMQVSWDRALCQNMCGRARKVHQESCVELLVKDYHDAFR